MRRVFTSGAGCAVMIAALVALAGPMALRAETIKIGAILPLTGNNEVQGQSMRDGLQLAVEVVNSRNGVNGKLKYR